MDEAQNPMNPKPDMPVEGGTPMGGDMPATPVGGDAPMGGDMPNPMGGMPEGEGTANE